MLSNIDIKNKKASFEFFLTDSYTAGIQLYGTEIKSIRMGKASLTDAYCYFISNELYVKMHIAEYSHRGYSNHDPRRERKLLLSRRELDKLEAKVNARGFAIVPVRLYLAENGFAKLEISLAEGKRKYDKRESLKEKENDRELDRFRKR